MSKLKVEVIESNRDKYDYPSELVVTHDGKEISRHSDCGEPEDNTFNRDWDWIVGEILGAYRLGLQDGRGIE